MEHFIKNHSICRCAELALPEDYWNTSVCSIARLFRPIFDVLVRSGLDLVTVGSPQRKKKSLGSEQCDALAATACGTQT
jgi:hypothetical protein